MRTCIVFFFSALAVSAALTPAASLLLRRLGFWNVMDGEHEKQVVRGGGIAIASTFLIFLLFEKIFTFHTIPHELFGFLPSLLILLATGIMDDRFGLKPRTKLLFQLASVIALWMGDIRITDFFGWHLPWYLSLALTSFWGISVLNAFNLIDGLDGLCTGNAMISSGAMLVIALLKHDSVLILSIMVFLGSCAGFLIYNFHPAKLFLGDTGSLFLGLICTVLSIKASDGIFNFHNTAAFLLIFWLPFCDLGLAVWRRKVKSLLRSSGCEIMERDRFHLHYRLLNVVQNHSLTVLIMWAGMFAFDFFAIMVYILQTEKITLAVLISTCLFSLIVLARYEISYTSCLFRHLERVEKNGNLRWNRRVHNDKRIISKLK